MRGHVLSYSPETGVGLLASMDGGRYTFKGTEFRGNVLTIRPGLEVEFEAHDDGTATAVFPIPAMAPVYQPTSDKSKIVAGILALFLGCWGIHKFYLGYTNAGITMLLVTLLTCCIGAPVMGIIALAEGIIYLTKSDAEFEELYVRNQHPWF